MLLWEALAAPRRTTELQKNEDPQAPVKTVRLPFDMRCSVVTKSGRRCRGRIRHGLDVCALHDPAVAQKRRESRAIPRRRNPLTYMPDGYLRRLSTTGSVGNAMDRLYREIRLGVVTPEMGKILFGILTRLMDAGLLDVGKPALRAPHRTKAARTRPKLRDLLTRGEKMAWTKAVAAASEELGSGESAEQLAARRQREQRSNNMPTKRRAAANPVPLKLQAAS